MSNYKRIKRAPQVLRKDVQPEAPRTTRLEMMQRALQRIPFSYTVFFTDENNMTVKFGQFAKLNEEYK